MIKKKIPVKELTPEQREAKKLKAREASLLRVYGITLDQYNELLKRQDEKCYICQRHASEFKTNLCVDHNHHTGEIRGLLCGYCNQRVVGRHRDPAVILRLYEYLSQGTGWFVPPKTKRRKRKKKNG